MPYRIKRGETVTEALHRIAEEQSERAIESLEARDQDDIEESVHDARKRCKKLRALARLVRPAMEDVYQAANACFRDAARMISDHRDAHARRETFDDLVEEYEELVPSSGLRGVREWLDAEAQRHTRMLVDDPSPMLRGIALIRDGMTEIEDVEVPDGFEAIGAGLAKTYARARNRLEDAREKPTVEAFHTLRKRTKYARYHVRLLRRTAPSVLDPYRHSLHDLTDALGDAHDLAVLATAVSDSPAPPDEKRAVETLSNGARVELERRARRLGERLLAEETDAYVERMRSYFEAWRSRGPELDTGGIETLSAD